MAHASRGFVLTPILNQGELAIMFCFVFLFISAAGGGAWSVDAARAKTAS
jgi:putative oxidoreductase